jgi:hypothetical protein
MLAVNEPILENLYLAFSNELIFENLFSNEPIS